MPIAGSVQAAVDVILITLSVHITTFIGLYVFMRKTIPLPVVWKSVAKYISASFLMGIVLFIVPATSTLIFTVAKAVAGLAIYISLLLIIDKQSRELLNLIIQEINGILRQLTSKNNGFQEENGTSTN